MQVRKFAEALQNRFAINSCSRSYSFAELAPDVTIPTCFVAFDHALLSCVHALLLPAGRSELPDNLKAMLRSVSMMVPDFTLIAEIMMFSEGFSSAKLLAKKMIAIMELSQQQLSKQDHYDATLRCVLCAK